MTAPQQFLTETRERFLKAVIAQLPADRIRELYLFQPIKQGGVESGVAVVAAYQEATGDGGRETGADDTPVAARQGPYDPHPTITGVVDLDEVTGPAAEADACELPPDNGGEASARDEESGVAASGAPDPGPATPDAPPTPDAQPRPAPDEKYTVYTARYRHTLKGPDRGKWEASIVAEAEAPLLSIETVVRGVQRRSGDVDPPDHMSGVELRAALRIPPAPDAT